MKTLPSVSILLVCALVGVLLAAGCTTRTERVHIKTVHQVDGGVVVE